MYSGGDPATALGSTLAIAIPAITSVGGTMATLASQPDEPSTPKIADSNKEVLGNWAQRMATDEDKMNNENSFLLRPGGARITFNPQQSRLPQNKFLLN